jgi:hypothetical protein
MVSRVVNEVRGINLFDLHCIDPRGWNRNGSPENHQFDLRLRSGDADPHGARVQETLASQDMMIAPDVGIAPLIQSHR